MEGLRILEFSKVGVGGKSIDVTCGRVQMFSGTTHSHGQTVLCLDLWDE